MSTPRSSRYDLAAKKSRATSCTNCRQVKLKCDLKERYPNPCSRCAANRHECRTDASFKRVPARSRIKDLESQIDQLKRDRAFSEATSRSSIERTPDVERCSPNNGLAIDNLAPYAVSEGLSYGSPTNSDLSQMDTKWLNLTVFDEPPHFALGDIAISFQHALELFRHFEEHCYPHFCILEPIISLSQLFRESPFLFWAIILTAARNHSRHASLVGRYRSHLDQLQSTVVADAVPSLLDLQALLLVCAFSVYESCALHRDRAWRQLGLAINMARQLGLDKSKDEIPLGTTMLPNSPNRHARHYRNMTWMKCFELDVQISCWHGHIPSLVGSHFLRVTAGFCERVSSFRYAALVSVDVELAQALASLEDDVQEPGQLVQMLVVRLDAVKTRWAAAWALDAELELLIAKLYLYGAYISSNENCTSDQRFYSETLPATRITAVQLSSLLANLTADGQAHAQSKGLMTNHGPFLGRSRHYMRSAFYTAIVLFTCLDNDHSITDEEKETAINAFGRLYQMFSTCSTSNFGFEATDAARTLQILGRAIRPGHGKLKPHVTTRMGASLVHNAIWLASQIQTQEEQSVESSMDVQPLSPMDPALDCAFVIPPHTQPLPLECYSGIDLLTTPASFDNSALNTAIWGSSTVGMPIAEAANGVWDSDVLEKWQASLSYPAGLGSCI